MTSVWRASDTFSPHFRRLYNLNIRNTYGKPVDQSQAIALSVEAGTFACYACQIRGTQDTLLANVVRLSRETSRGNALVTDSS